MGTETFPFAVTFANDIFQVSEPTNGNYVLEIPLANSYMNSHPTLANLYYIGNVGYAILLDYTLCTNLTTASRLAQINAIVALASASAGTITVNQGTSPWVTSVTNFPATQAVTQSTSPWVTSVSNFPATQTVTGTVAVTQSTTPWVTSNSLSIPVSTDLVGASRNTTGTLVTIPAGRTFMGAVSLSCSLSLAGSCEPTISITGTGALPSGIIHQIICVGLSLTVVANSNTIDNVFIFGGTGGATVTFTAGASGTSTGQICGHLL